MGRHIGTACAFIYFAHAQQTLSSSPRESPRPSPSPHFAHEPNRPSPQTLPGCPTRERFSLRSHSLHEVQSVRPNRNEPEALATDACPSLNSSFKKRASGGC